MFKDLMWDIKYEVGDLKTKMAVKKLLKFTSESQLPNDTNVLFSLFLKLNGEDDDRAFICAKKGSELNSQFLQAYLAEYYIKGIATEKNEDLARETLVKFLVSKFSKSNVYTTYLDIKRLYEGHPGFIYTEAQKEAAKILISQNSPIGIFLLEDALLAESINLPIMATFEQQEKAYLTVQDNPLAKYHLYLTDDKKYGHFLKEAAEDGCFFAACTLSNGPLYREYLNTAKEILAQGYDYALELFTSKISKDANPYMLFTEAVKQYNRGEDSLDNPAWAKINEAVELGNKQAYVWAAEKKAKLGDAWGEAAMGEILLEGLYDTEKDTDRGVLMLMRSSGKGNPYGQYKWAQVLEKGLYNIPADIEQAINLYNKSAQQGNLDACLRLAYIYCPRPRRDVNKVLSYISPVLKVDRSTPQGNAQFIEANIILVHLYSEFHSHSEVYPTLETALKYAFIVAQAQLANYENEAIQKAIADYDTTIRTPQYIYLLANRYYFMLKETGEYSTFVLHEVFQLWYILLKEQLANAGDVDSMIGLYDAYREVGSYTHKKYSDRNSVSFAGNTTKRIYWLDKAIAAGSTTAMRTKGEDWKLLGLTEAEGEMWLKKARAMGDENAADTLRINKMSQQKQAEFEKNIMEYLAAERSNSAAKANKDKENMDAVHSVHSMPTVITGPYNRNYTRHSISAFSAEYINEFSEIITIEDADIGATGTNARNEYGYFYW